MTRSEQKSDFLIAFLLFCAVFVVYAISANTPMSDSIWATHISSSLLNAGDINLDEFARSVEELNNFGVLPNPINGHILPQFPIGNSLIGAPVYWLVEKLYPLPAQQDLYHYLQQVSPSDATLIQIQHIVASIITALIAPLFYFIGRVQYDRRVSLVAALLFALGSSAYSVASRVLWQHGPSMLMLALTLFLLLKGQKKPQTIRWAGIPLAFSYVIRPTNSVSVFVITLYVLLFYRKQLVGFLTGAALVAIPFILFNQLTYQQWLPPYFQPRRIGISPHFFQALAGNLVSPARGLFVYSPILLFAGFGIVVKLRRHQWRALDTALLVIILLHWLVISSFGHWWGGHSYGPRFFSDMLPFLFYFLLPGLDWLLPVSRSSPVRLAALFVAAVLALFSVATHTIGANVAAVNAWNQVPVSLDYHASERLWDWSDLLFMRRARDWPVLASGYDIAIDRELFEPGQQIPLFLQNQADQAYTWAIKTPETVRLVSNPALAFTEEPSGIQKVVGKQPILPGEGQLLQLTVETDVSAVEDASLGALAVSVRDAHGSNVSLQIIPVSVLENGREWREGNALDTRLWLPEDVTVNGRNPESNLYALFGAGWYLLETLEDNQWRWARSPSELYIYRAKPGNVTLSYTIGEMASEDSGNGLGDSGLLRINAAGQELEQEIKRGQPQQVTLWLDSGWNVLTMALDAGNFRPVDVQDNAYDSRLLSFTLSSLDLSTAE